MTPVLAPCSQLQMDVAPRLIRVERMDKNKIDFFIQDLSAGIVFGSIFQTSEAAERVEYFFRKSSRFQTSSFETTEFQGG